MLLVESGSRRLYEELLPGLYETYAGQISVDLLTCYAGAPDAFRHDLGRVFRITEYPKRGPLYKELAARRYTITGIICSAEPIMTKWKWMIAARVPAKVFVLNENNDYFWLDWGRWSSIRLFLLYRCGLHGAGAVRTLARLVLFPFTLIYLILYAAAVHLRRKVQA